MRLPAPGQPCCTYASAYCAPLKRKDQGGGAGHRHEHCDTAGGGRGCRARDGAGGGEFGRVVALFGVAALVHEAGCAKRCQRGSWVRIVHVPLAGAPVALRDAVQWLYVSLARTISLSSMRSFTVSETNRDDSGLCNQAKGDRTVWGLACMHASCCKKAKPRNTYKNTLQCGGQASVAAVDLGSKTPVVKIGRWRLQPVAL